MTEGLGHDFDEYYICRRCRLTEYDALMGKIVCPGNDEPLIVDESQGNQVVAVHYERGDDGSP